MAGQTHIVGAGLAGLAAAVAMAGAGRRVILHEAAPQAGGRCRSYPDPVLGIEIDNGNHLMLSANHAALAYLKAIGASDALIGPDQARFPFFDHGTGERWTLSPNTGAVPWWIFAPGRRVPGSSAIDYLAPSGILLARNDRAIGAVMACAGPLYDRLWGPLLLAGLNTPPAEGSTRLAAKLMRESLMAGGEACRPLVARHGLSRAFVEPALAHLAAKGAEIRFGRRLRALELGPTQVAGLTFADGAEPIGPRDALILAVPPPAAAELVPGLGVPRRFHAILNAHFKIAPPVAAPQFIGIVNATTEWVFAYPDRLSVTISSADRLMDEPRETLAARLWPEVARAMGIATTGLDSALPIWQIVKEKRATFAATPEENARRPGALTRWSNLTLAGDWVQTGLPATIEGAIRSGNTAAQALMAMTEPA